MIKININFYQSSRNVLFLLLFNSLMIISTELMAQSTLLEGLYIHYNVDALKSVHPDVQMIYINKSLDSCSLLSYGGLLICELALNINGGIQYNGYEMLMEWNQPYLTLRLIGEALENQEASFNYLRISKVPVLLDQINTALHPFLEIVYGHYFYKYPLRVKGTYGLCPVSRIEDNEIYFYFPIGKKSIQVFRLDQ